MRLESRSDNIVDSESMLSIATLQQDLADCTIRAESLDEKLKETSITVAGLNRQLAERDSAAHNRCPCCSDLSAVVKPIQRLSGQRKKKTVTIAEPQEKASAMVELKQLRETHQIECQQHLILRNFTTLLLQNSVVADIVRAANISVPSHLELNITEPFRDTRKRKLHSNDSHFSTVDS